MWHSTGSNRMGLDQQPSLLKRRLLLGLVLFGLCSVLALLSTLGSYISDIGQEGQGLLGPLLRQEFKSWYACGMLAIGVLWVCGWNRLEPGRIKHWVTVHMGFALLFAVLYAVGVSWWVAGEKSVMHPGQILTFSYLLEKLFIHYLVINLIMYWMVVFGYLGWHYYGRYLEREAETAHLQRELMAARLEALRMQLNPHFLFNTLHAVSALIHEDPEAADRVVARLSELLRLSLDQTKPQEVPLRDEMAFLDRYLEIEQTRFADRLKVEKDIDGSVQDALVPYLVLQPLVENAIRHGIEPREDQGRLAIRARRTNGMLELRVEDNGNGLANENGEPPAEGIGLTNTRSRLRHLYGEDFRLELTAAKGGGLQACIDIPYHTETLPPNAAN